MKKKFKQILATFLTVIMLFSALTLCAFAASVDDLEYETKNGEITITYCDESAFDELVIPSKINNYPVTHIGNYAFCDCWGITSVTIPDSIKSIGNWVFSDCGNLESVTIPDSVTSIGDYIFYGCYSLTSVTIPGSVKSIGKCTFYGCNNLENITIPDSITSIGDSAFYGCYSLFSVTIPDSVVSIGDWAFSDCNILNSITIPDSVTSIGGYAFNNCWNLESVTIPDKITSISQQTFGGCCNLLSVTIPEGVTSIGNSAFNDCVNLSDVYFGGTKEQWDEIAIGKNNEDLLNATIHFAKVNHTHTLSHIIDPASCTVEGKEYDICTECNEILNSVTIPVTDHTWGEWTTAVKPTADAQGISQRECTECHEKETKAIPKLCVVKINDVELKYKTGATIKPVITAEDGVKYTVKYESSNQKVATVDKDGNITTAGKGETTITCTVTDDNGNVAKDTCKVTVKFSFGQWLIWILLFGFLWY